MNTNYLSKRINWTHQVYKLKPSSLIRNAATRGLQQKPRLDFYLVQIYLG